MRARVFVTLGLVVVCSGLALLALASASGAPAASQPVPERQTIHVAANKTIQVAATTTFAATGVVLAKGEKAKLTATGLISYGSLGPESCRGQNVPPSGCAAEAICPRPGPCGALVGRFKGGAPFLVGKSKTVTGPGSLELGINDGDGAYGDNFGSFTVTIARSSSCPIAKTAVGRSGSVTSAAKKCFTLSGRVFERKCVDPSGSVQSSSCQSFAPVQQFVPAEGRSLIASGPTTAEQSTDKNGRYTLHVKKGTYKLRVPGVKTDPKLRTLNVTHDVHNLDFHLCKAASGKAVGCDLVEIHGRTVSALDGLRFSYVGVEGPGDFVLSDLQGRFKGLFVPRGKAHLIANGNFFSQFGTSSKQTVNATGDVNAVTLKLPLRFLVFVNSKSDLNIVVSGLPRAPVTVHVRTSPQPNASCSYDQSQEVATRSDRYIRFGMTANRGEPGQDPTFCSGRYTGTVQQGNKTLATYFPIDVP